MTQFKVGDKVRLKDQASYQGEWAGLMTVDEEQPRVSGLIYLTHPKHGEGAFPIDEVEAATAEAQAPTEFKVGDKVRVSTDYWGEDQLGDEGVVIQVGRALVPGMSVRVEFDYNQKQGHPFNTYRPKDLELIEAAPAEDAPFKVGDRVRYKEENFFLDGEDSHVITELDNGGLWGKPCAYFDGEGGFDYVDLLELVEAA